MYKSEFSAADCLLYLRLGLCSARAFVFHHRMGGWLGVFRVSVCNFAYMYMQLDNFVLGPARSGYLRGKRSCSCFTYTQNRTRQQSKQCLECVSLKMEYATVREREREIDRERKRENEMQTSPCRLFFALFCFGRCF